LLKLTIQAQENKRMADEIKQVIFLSLSLTHTHAQHITYVYSSESGPKVSKR